MQNQTVVTTQPGAGSSTIVLVQNQNQNQTKDWSTGLFGCFEDLISCAAAFFCPEFYPCYLAYEAGEFPCLFCCVPGWEIALRARIRAENGIPGSICGDCLVVHFCYICALTQMHRQIKNVKNGTA